jgi:hypothetical protein
LTGHLANFWEDIENSIWIGGLGDGGLHERVPYWLNGIVPLAYQLRNQTLNININRPVVNDGKICNNGTDMPYSDIIALPVKSD